MAYGGAGHAATRAGVHRYIACPEGGTLPGSITVLVDGKPVRLIKPNDLYSIRLGRDPALFDAMPAQMRQNLERIGDIGPAPKR